MGVVEFFLFVLLDVLLGAGVVWLLGRFAPTHPKVIDAIVWVVVVIIIVAMLVVAFGLTGYDPQIPRLRRG